MVANPHGSQELTRAGEATDVDDAESAPKKPRILSPKEINSLFGAVLAAQPDPVKTFLLYFKSGTTSLTQESEQRIPEILEAIRSRHSVDVSIVGHSDTRGDAGFNLILSKRRALEVAKILLSRDVAPATIDIASHGEANPLIPTPDETDEARNRRVSVTVR